MLKKIICKTLLLIVMLLAFIRDCLQDTCWSLTLLGWYIQGGKPAAAEFRKNFGPRGPRQNHDAKA